VLYRAVGNGPYPLEASGGWYSGPGANLKVHLVNRGGLSLFVAG
jgi:hypothetical protein